MGREHRLPTVYSIGYFHIPLVDINGMGKVEDMGGGAGKQELLSGRHYKAHRYRKVKELNTTIGYYFS